MYKIAHTADIHLRAFQYLDEIEFTFDRFYESLLEENPDALVISGDFFHSKLSPSHEYFEMASKFFRRFSEICPIIIIPGNHDISLQNTTRLDAITPIVEALKGLTKNPIIYSKYSEIIEAPNSSNILFHHFSILDKKKDWPKIAENSNKKENVNIALYHGSINGCKVDNGWISRGNKDNISIFRGFDFAMLGDIHVSQFLDGERRIAYPGSLRQNNYGENVDKGYLIWEIESANKFEVKRVVLEQKRYFISIYGSSVDDVKNLGDLPEDSRIRFILTKDVNLSEHLKIKSEIEKLYKPHGEVSVIFPDNGNTVGSIKVGDLDILHENIRQPEVQKHLIKEYFKDKNLTDKDIKEISNLDKKYHSYVETDVERNTLFRLNWMKSNNTFSFGKNNFVDFRKINGLVGVFGNNAAGKSSGIVDNISLGLFNKVNKEGANKNIDYINRLTDNADVSISLSMNNKDYLIKRTFKKKKVKDEEQCLTTIDFWNVDGKKKKSLNGEKKPDTNQAIKKKIGTEEDFDFTSLCAQFNLTNFIDAKGTKRKESLAKYFDLQIFDTKFQIAKADLDDINSKISGLDYSGIETDIETTKLELQASEQRQREILQIKIKKEQKIENLETEIRNIYKKLKESKFNEKDKDSTDFEIIKLEQQISEINKSINDLSKNISSFKEFDKTLEEFKLEYQERKHNLIKAVELKKSIEKEKRIAVETSDLLKKIPNVPQCQICPLVKNAFEANGKVVQLVKKIDSLNKECDISELSLKSLDYSDIISRWQLSENSEKEILVLKSKLESLKILFELKYNLKKEIEENIDFINHNKSVKEEIQIKEAELSEIKKNLLNLNGEYFDISKRIGAEEERIKILKKDLSKTEELTKLKHYYELYLDAMGKNGISYWIISKKMPAINKQVNYILSHTVNFKLFIEDNESEKSVKIYIVDEKGKRPIELGSGMEKTVASIAIRAALWKICLLPKTPILILDEAFAHLDSEKNEGIIKLLTHLKSYFEIIFIITHDEGLKGMVDHAFYVGKDSTGMSNLEIK